MPSNDRVQELLNLTKNKSNFSKSSWDSSTSPTRNEKSFDSAYSASSQPNNFLPFIKKCLLISLIIWISFLVLIKYVAFPEELIDLLIIGIPLLICIIIAYFSPPRKIYKFFIGLIMNVILFIALFFIMF